MLLAWLGGTLLIGGFAPGGSCFGWLRAAWFFLRKTPLLRIWLALIGGRLLLLIVVGLIVFIVARVGLVVRLVLIVTRPLGLLFIISRELGLFLIASWRRSSGGHRRSLGLASLLGAILVLVLVSRLIVVLKLAASIEIGRRTRIAQLLRGHGRGRIILSWLFWYWRLVLARLSEDEPLDELLLLQLVLSLNLKGIDPQREFGALIQSPLIVLLNISDLMIINCFLIVDNWLDLIFHLFHNVLVLEVGQVCLPPLHVGE